MNYKIKQEFIDYLKTDSVLIAKIANVCNVTTATISRNWLYGRNVENLLRLDVLETIQIHLEDSLTYSVKTIWDIVHKIVHNNTKNVPNNNLHNNKP